MNAMILTYRGTGGSCTPWQIQGAFHRGQKSPEPLCQPTAKFNEGDASLPLDMYFCRLKVPTQGGPMVTFRELFWPNPDPGGCLCPSYDVMFWETPQPPVTAGPSGRVAHRTQLRQHPFVKRKSVWGPGGGGGEISCYIHGLPPSE